MSGQHYVLDGAFHGVHLLRGGRQEGQGPDALLRTGVAEVATLVFLPVALQGGQRKRCQGDNQTAGIFHQEPKH